MSILNGAIHTDVIREEPMPYGEPLEQTGRIPLSGCFDVAVDERARYAYAAHQGALSVFDWSDPAHPVLLSTLEGLGASRQIAVRDGYAYITARADGLYIVDVRDARHPKLAAHYDSLELATGVAVNGGLCLVANRHLGVELLDVSEPAAPRFLSAVLAGEAQSVCIDGGYMYVGDWMNKTVHVFDIRDPGHPAKISSMAVDGYADGVCARDGYCYIATGHHSARLKNRRKYYHYTYVVPEMFEDGYGCGHGLEIFDVADPHRPEYVSSVKFPPLYVSGFDTWLVQVSGSYAYVADTFNGLFVVDISDIGRPSFKGHFRLPLMDKPEPASPPSLQRLSYPATGFALARGAILAAGYMTGLHTIRWEECEPAPNAGGRADGPSEADDAASAVIAADGTGPVRSFVRPAMKPAYSGGGQIHTVDFCSGAAFLAAGNDGLLAVDAANPGTVLHRIQESPIVHDVQVLGHLVITAEGQRGAAVYEFDPAGGFTCKARYEFGADSARQITLFPGKRRIAVQLANNAAGLLSIGEDGRLALAGRLEAGGALYHRHLCRTPLDERWLGVMPLSVGLTWFDVGGETPVKTPWAIGKQSCPIEEGAAIVRGRTVLIQKRQYLIAEKPEHIADPDARIRREVAGASLTGQPFVCGDMLVLVNRCLGTAEFIDIREVDRPRFVKRIGLPGHPEYAALHDGKYWICCGHAGLFVVEGIG